MLRFIDGFDHYTSSTDLGQKWNSVSGTWATTTGRLGTGTGNAMQQSGTGSSTGWIGKTLDNQQTWIVGFALFATYAPTAILISSFVDGATSQVELRATATSGQLYVTRNGTTIASSSTAIPFNTWCYLEFKATIASGTGGSFDVHLNGASVLSATGVNTQASANAYASVIQIGYQFTNSSGHGPEKFDDVYIADGQAGGLATFAGDVKVTTLLPNGAGNSTQWTPSSGANYTTVNDNPENGDTSYVSSSTAGQIDLYTTAGGIAGTPLAVAITQFARKDDAGTRQIAAHLRSSTTEVDGTTRSPGTSYAVYQDIWEKDPATTAAWTAAGANAAQIGVKCIA